MFCLKEQSIAVLVCPDGSGKCEAMPNGTPRGSWLPYRLRQLEHRSEVVNELTGYAARPTL
jgi:hypothetical protein